MPGGRRVWWPEKDYSIVSCRFQLVRIPYAKGFIRVKATTAKPGCVSLIFSLISRDVSDGPRKVAS